jgi:hypothetical protein
MQALVIGGTGPTGPFIVNGLRERGYKVAILHRGTHETDAVPATVERIVGDPHFRETLAAALADRRFDLVVATYGRIRFVAEALVGKTPRLITMRHPITSTSTCLRFAPNLATMTVCPHWKLLSAPLHGICSTVRSRRRRFSSRSRRTMRWKTGWWRSTGTPAARWRLSSTRGKRTITPIRTPSSRVCAEITGRAEYYRQNNSMFDCRRTA